MQHLFNWWWLSTATVMGLFSGAKMALPDLPLAEASWAGLGVISAFCGLIVVIAVTNHQPRHSGGF